MVLNLLGKCIGNNIPVPWILCFFFFRSRAEISNCNPNSKMTKRSNLSTVEDFKDTNIFMHCGFQPAILLQAGVFGSGEERGDGWRHS